jgi:hypothetical protein
VTAPTFCPVIHGAVAGLRISEGVARRHGPSQIVRNSTGPLALAASSVPLGEAVGRDVLVELEMGLLTLDELVVMAWT